MLRKSKFLWITIFVVFVFVFTNTASAHCDSIKGPVVKAAQKVLETSNINYVFVWIKAEHEKEIKNLFDRVLRVRKAGGEAKDLADKYFFETVVRLHRMGEGVGYTGLKSEEYKPEKGIEEADRAIETKSLTNVLVALDKKHYLKVNDLFNDLQSKSSYSVNYINAGREYVESYVHFIHYVEALYAGNTEQTEEHHHN